MRIGTAPADFDHPLEMLEACHDRIEERLETLARLVEHLAQHGADDQARQAAANVMRYFDTAGEHHHEDEELDLFPKLAASSASDGETMQLIEHLRRDHTEMRRIWPELRAALDAIPNGSGALDAALVQRFIVLYRRHIELEESKLLPLAQRALALPEQAALGAAMAARRGVKR